MEDGQLFYVEQFEIASKDGSFDGFFPGRHGGFYGRTDGDLRWDFAVTVRLATSLLVEGALQVNTRGVRGESV